MQERVFAVWGSDFLRELGDAVGVWAWEVSVQAQKSAPVSTIRRIWSNHQAARSRPQGRTFRERRGVRRTGIDGISIGSQAVMVAFVLLRALCGLFMQ